MTSKQATKRKQDVSAVLAHNLVSMRYEDIPAFDREETKKRIADAIGCTFTGYQDRTSRIVMHLLVDQGGKPEATILGSGHRVPQGLPDVA